MPAKSDPTFITSPLYTLLNETGDSTHHRRLLEPVDSNVHHERCRRTHGRLERRLQLDLAIHSATVRAQAARQAHEVDQWHLRLYRLHLLDAHALLDHSVLRVVENDEHRLRAILHRGVDLVVHQEGSVADDGHGLAVPGEGRPYHAGRSLAHRSPAHAHSKSSGRVEPEVVGGPGK